MQVHHNIESLPQFRNAVITVGTFDGVHKGHQQLIGRILQLSKQISGESVLITFDPHPRAVIYPNDQSLRLLSTTEEKIKLLESFQVDHLVIVPFTKEFSMLSARDYIENFLVEKFHPAVIVIGYNHHFGHHRDGNIELLRSLSTQFDFRIEEIPKQMVDEIEVSSTRIRIAMQEGDVSTASHLLGHPYSLTGKVVKGNQLGRKLEFPTANISIADQFKLIPADGVYAVKVLVNEDWKHGAMNIGYRPTVNGTHHTIEVYIFDFSSDLYEQEITVQFIEFIREEKKFETLDLMVEEIQRDEEIARKILQMN
ncbi:MAG: bifunctional riboflavin kinase/FAD synthetase [Chitinophagales bacterium]